MRTERKVITANFENVDSIEKFVDRVNYMIDKINMEHLEYTIYKIETNLTEDVINIRIHFNVEEETNNE